MATTALGEFLGTLVLILFGNGVVAGVLLKDSKAEGSGWLVIALGWGVAVLLGVFTSLAFGGPGELNPAVTLANLAIGAHTASVAQAHVLAQFGGGMVGAALVWLHYLPHWERTDDAGRKLACFSTGPAIRSTTANFLSEVIGAAALVFVAKSVLSVAAQGAQPASNFAPVLVGTLVLGIGMSLGGTTGYGINPARDLGPRMMHALLPIAGKGSSDWSYAWIPVVGPIVGAVLAAMAFTSLQG
jgi:glycerol uptake facilitator protein